MTGRGEVVVAFDYGSRRIGVAVGQTLTGTASPTGALPSSDTGPDWGAVKQCLHEWGPSRVLVGLPYNMDGSETTTTAACRRFGAELARRSSLPVEFVDERLTSAAGTAPARGRGTGGVAR